MGTNIRFCRLIVQKFGRKRDRFERLYRACGYPPATLDAFRNGSRLVPPSLIKKLMALPDVDDPTCIGWNRRGPAPTEHEDEDPFA